MKLNRVIILLVFIFISYSVCSADEEWNNFSNASNMWDGQKSITNKEFEDAINVIEKDKKQKEAKKRKRMIKKVSGGGTSLHAELDPNNTIKAPNELNLEDNKNGVLINLTMPLKTPDDILEEGYYNVFLEKENNVKYIKFYQAHYLKGKIKAYDTNEDFGEMDLNFAKVLPYNSNYCKIIYGNMLENVYSYLKYIK